MGRPFLIGITGPICTGKSTIADAFSDKSIPVVSGDNIGHRILNQQGIINRLVEELGDSIRDDGGIDRKKLSEMVFEDETKMNLLNEIVHPPLLDEMWNEIDRSHREGNEIIVVDASLIYFWGIEKRFNIIITALAPPNKRIGWIEKRFNIDRAGALKRLNFHLKIETQILNAKRRPDFVIANDNDLSTLKERAEQIVKEVMLIYGLYNKS
ncbi:MAG: dephospho-CoA kinase [Candidatus Coatesbacteria bacterium]|nr:MAG: dephospho-CoA kinase [Candidatus Coatesbacteria bacterium]RLC41554.1 MAG: dephospho-CoA kinase [Candidatus Coatesbacteria bacterium]